MYIEGNAHGINYCDPTNLLIGVSRAGLVRTEQQIENVGKNRAGFRRAEERVICPEGLMSGKTLVS